jgi:ankyrin repeat protein
MSTIHRSETYTSERVFLEIATMFWPNDNTQHDQSTGVARNVSIHQAAADDDLARVSELLDSGVEVNGRNESLQTALHRAIINDNSTMVQLLLSREAGTSLRDNGTFDEPDGFTPVESAARLNAIAAMQELIAHGVNAEFSSAVFLAARENHLDMLRLLFDKSSGSMSDASRQRAIADALRVSAKNQSLEIVKFVLQKLAHELEPSMRSDHWQGALDLALLAVFDCENADGDGGLPDYIRDQNWDHAIRIIDILVEAGASINTHGDDPTKHTALHSALAAQGPSLKLITSLLHHGADPNLRDSCGRSAFFELLGHPKVTLELIKVFTDAGAVVGLPAARGQTPLHCVRNPSIASWLITLGADIAAVDDQGETPLHKASSTGNLELVSLYLDANTPIDKRNDLGWTPFIQSRSVSISKMLLDHGADIHATTDQGLTAIHHAADSCNLELVLFLLANGADVHSTVARQEHNCDFNRGPTITIDGKTPLHLAVASAHGASMGQTLEVVNVLLDHGADIEAKEGSGKTPLLLAISTKFYNMGTWTPNEKVVNHLLEHGANPHAVDDAAKNAFQLADDMNYMFSKIGKFERKPVPSQSSYELDTGFGRGRGRGAYGRGGFNS